MRRRRPCGYQRGTLTVGWLTVCQTAQELSWVHACMYSTRQYAPCSRMHSSQWLCALRQYHLRHCFNFGSNRQQLTATHSSSEYRYNKHRNTCSMHASVRRSAVANSNCLLTNLTKSLTNVQLTTKQKNAAATSIEHWFKTGSPNFFHSGLDNQFCFFFISWSIRFIKS